jgi:antirestriction protein ArdC
LKVSLLFNPIHLFREDIVTDISTDDTPSRFIKSSHSELPASATNQVLSSLSQRTPDPVFSCSTASPDAGEESVFLHKQNNNKQMRKEKSQATSTDMYEVVTNRIIEKLEQGELSWRKTWSSYGLARNYVSGKTYRGINMLLMNFFSPHSVPYYLTFKQAKNLGGNVKQGAKALPVFYFNVIFKDANDQTISKEQAEAMGDDVKVIKFLKYYNVFNVEDIEGVEFKINDLQLLPHEKIARCEQVWSGYPAAPQYVEKDRSRAYYSPTEDTINMPPIEQFETAEDYYATLFHESIHSTGHPNRLNREGIAQFDRFGSERYSLEELIAELGASFLCGLTGIDREPVIENTAAYIQGWLKKLKDDKQFIFKAAAEAQKAVDYIVSDGFAETAEE